MQNQQKEIESGSNFLCSVTVPLEHLEEILPPKSYFGVLLDFFHQHHSDLLMTGLPRRWAENGA